MALPAEISFHNPEECLNREITQTEKHESFAGEVFSLGGASRRHATIALNHSIALDKALTDEPYCDYTADMKVEISAGHFAREVRNPANTLARGVYEASFDFSIHNERRIMDGPGTLVFGLDNTRDYDWRFPTETWSGIFRLAWQRTRTEAS